MTQYTLVSNDILYIAFYLKEKDPTTNSITPYNLSSANSIVFRMREYTQSTVANTLSLVMGTLNSTGSLNTDGYARVLCTIPSSGTYKTEIEVFDGNQVITWIATLKP